MGIDNPVAVEDTYSSATPINSRTVGVTVPALTHGVLVVCVNVIGFATLGDCTGITADGNAMTKAVQTADTAPYVDLWYLPDPPDDATYNVVASFEGNGTTTGVQQMQMVVGYADSDEVIELIDTDTLLLTDTTDPAAIAATGTAASLTISSNATADNNVPVTDKTLMHDVDQGGNCAAADYSNNGAGGAITHSWNRGDTGISSVFNAAIALFQEEAGGGAVVKDPIATGVIPFAR